MKRGLIKKEDIMQGVRKTILQDSIEGIDKIYLEHNGEISLIKKIRFTINESEIRCIFPIL